MTREVTITVASPSLVAALDRCGLAVSLGRHARAAGVSHAPSTPRARLGSAAHRVLQWAADDAPQLARADDLDAVVRQRWLKECEREQSEARHPAEASYGPVREWPRFATIQANLVVAVSDLVDELADLPPEHRLTEIRTATAEGDIAGRIDLLILNSSGHATVVDHKVGAITEADVVPGGRYHTQVLLYAAMARDMGLKPVQTEIRPLGREPIVLHPSDADLAQAVKTAGQAIAHYNTAVQEGDELSLAQPSEDACRWCPFLVRCQAIWSGQEVDVGNISGVEGTLTSPVQLQRNGQYAALVLTTANHEVTITGLRTARTPIVRELEVGNRVRVAGLHRSADGRSYRPSSGRTDACRLE